MATESGLWKIKNVETLLSYILSYNNGLIIGDYKVYYEYYKPIKKEDGSMSNIKCDTTFYETTFVDGNGIWKDFYSNGDLKETGQYKSGKKEGEWLYYFESNILYLKRYFEKGILIREEGVEVPPEFILQIRKEM